MTLYVIFPIHVNFPITSRCVLKAPIHKKTVNCFPLLKNFFFFFQKGTFLILYVHVVFNSSISSRSDSVFHVSLSPSIHAAFFQYL